jgi:hypothetical protein
MRAVLETYCMLEDDSACESFQSGAVTAKSERNTPWPMFGWEEKKFSPPFDH